ncbi:ABC-type multidrug transport system, ATPase component [Lentimicrobium saccharophilum]|uniref:ABC-type multidrug transport system, ATPase component n=1 Tax=Lentimicrobium saccharophilum TaxID=1678841 RepID=A0A0S7BRX1_9BACT|nr:ATP-binding cassette domain-containing protein [Lentimicrobium saccharophilum]GAP43117.1 ABC-type multidrug transport system, ATPase component [Lentimicrobium saccharophilum]
MLNITLENAGKQYNHTWIFSDLNATLASGQPTAILGANGSGKSTLLQMIASAIMPSSGTVSYSLNGNIIRAEQAFRLMSIAAPYMELIEDFTLTEMICFHRRLKPLMRNMTTAELIRIMQLEENAGKPIRYFSSGMKQRVKLALAIMSDTPALLLDEPVSNLDQKAVEWFRGLIGSFGGERLIVISSNSVASEHDFCTNTIRMEDYKSRAHAEPAPMFL